MEFFGEIGHGQSKNFLDFGAYADFTVDPEALSTFILPLEEQLHRLSSFFYSPDF